MQTYALTEEQMDAQHEWEHQTANIKAAFTVRRIDTIQVAGYSVLTIWPGNNVEVDMPKDNDTAALARLAMAILHHLHAEDDTTMHVLATLAGI